MKIKRVGIYNPLFNNGEREEGREIAQVLEKAGYKTWLAERDSFLMSRMKEELRGLYDNERREAELANKLCAYVDMFYFSKCDAGVINLNGRIPDEGSLVEAAVAFANGKPIVAYKADSRALIDGFDNPEVRALSGFQVIHSIQDIPTMLEELKRRKVSQYEESLAVAEKLFKGIDPRDTIAIKKRLKKVFRID